MELIVTKLLQVLALYLGVGVVFAIVFVFRGVTAIDPTARDGASLGFRVAIFPATVALWPLLARRWWGGRNSPPEECSPHRCAACSREGGCGGKA